MTSVESTSRRAAPVTRDLSLVIPVFNEAENVQPLLQEITAALATRDASYEVIFVDDGSHDGSYEALRKLAQEDAHVVVIRFRRNFGQTAAFAAGFRHASGDVIVTLDADRQNDPADIPALLHKLDEGYDVVNGWRANRKDPFLLRKLPSRVANALIAWASGVHLRDRGCSLRAFRAPVLNELHLYGEMHRFIPEMVNFAGFRMAEVPVNHRLRTAGQSKYGLSRTFRVILDLITVLFLRRYSDRPMHLLGGIGIISTGLGSLIALYLALLKLWGAVTGGAAGFRAVRIGDRPLLMLAILLMFIGVQFLVMGLLAELIVRTYYESQGKAVYHVQEVLAHADGAEEGAGHRNAGRPDTDRERASTEFVSSKNVKV
ncbi:MAG TPA: glycosyltransferase family 2 protein [Candidatus Binatia bacterium]|jgi:glycosyltransferase involved in cell wall biosynthesis|nr:glycosyltransferase family 2 protein [Candidatus Binatia bacterium]